MSKISTLLVISLVITACIVGMVVGYALSPEYQFGAYDKTTTDLGRPDRWLECHYNERGRYAQPGQRSHRQYHLSPPLSEGR